MKYNASWPVVASMSNFILGTWRSSLLYFPAKASKDQLVHFCLNLGRKVGCIRLRACFIGCRSGSIDRQCMANAGSRPGISECVHANTSWFCFRKWRYSSLSLGDIFSLMNIGRGCSSESNFCNWYVFLLGPRMLKPKNANNNDEWPSIFSLSGPDFFFFL